MSDDCQGMCLESARYAARCLEAVMESAEQKGLTSAEPDSLEKIMVADGWARQRASDWVDRARGLT